MGRRQLPTGSCVVKTYYRKAQILYLSNGEYWVFDPLHAEYLRYKTYFEADEARKSLLQGNARRPKDIDYPSSW